jgi:Tfp pilus assembly protein PilF
VLLDLQGETDAARIRFQEALAQQPYLPILHFNYGVFALQHGQIDLARSRIDRAIELDANYAAARYAAALIAVEAGNTGRAQTELRWFERTAPQGAHAKALSELIGALQ